MFYPVQYEGEESSYNIFYTGAAPNQQAIPAVDYLMSEDGGSVKRWVLAGTDYVYPRTTNKILEQYLLDKGVAPEDIMINYTPFGHSDWQTIVSDIKAFGSAGKKTAVVSTINGDANVPFYKELGNQGISAEDIPVIAFSVGEEELAGLDTTPLVGHLAAWNYFQSVDAPSNAAFIEAWHAFIGNPERVTNDPMEAHYIGFNMWVKAVEKAGTTDADAVIAALLGIETPNLTGGIAKMLPNHHITKPVLIGEIQDDGQFEIVWETDGLVPGDAWSDFLPEIKMIEADWVDPIKCGNYNTETKACGGAATRKPCDLLPNWRRRYAAFVPSEDHSGPRRPCLELLTILALLFGLLATAPALAQTADAELTVLVDALGPGSFKDREAAVRRARRDRRHARPTHSRRPLRGRPLHPRGRRQGGVRRCRRAPTSRSPIR